MPFVVADGDRCTFCPRSCGKLRTPESRGLCGSAEPLPCMRVAYIGLHAWEEPCLSGDRGSGTIFFSGCSLGCSFCQNAAISQSWTGERQDPAGLASHMLALQESGAHNINLVTGAHVLPAVAQSIGLAKAQGMTLPVVWNTGSYEKVETLRMLEGLVDIYLPDLKYEDPLLSLALCNAENYASVAHAAILEMHRQTGAYEKLENGLLVHGLLVRHLVLPGCIRDSSRVLEWLAANLPMDIRLSLLAQYTPMPHIHIPADEILSKALQRTISTFEYQKVLEKAMSLGFTRILTQERMSAGQRYIPPFSCGSGSWE